MRLRAEELKLPQAERERKRAGEFLVAAPERKAARDGAEEQRIYDPEREAREHYCLGERRNLDLVVQPRLAPRLDEANAPKPPPVAETSGIYVAIRPVDCAGLEHRRRRDRHHWGVLLGHYKHTVHDGPSVGGVRRVVPYLHIDCRELRVSRGDALGLYEELEFATGERDHAPAAKVLYRDKRPVRD